MAALTNKPDAQAQPSLLVPEAQPAPATATALTPSKDLLGWFKHGVSLPRLLDGKFTTTFTTALIEGKTPYIQISIKLPDRIFTYGLFPSNITGFIDGLKEQLSISDQSINPSVLFDKFATQPVDLWLEHRKSEKDGRTYINWYTKAPAEAKDQVSEAETAVDTSELPI